MGVDVVVLSVGEGLPDQVPAVGGGVDFDVFGGVLDAAFEERLEGLVLDLVLFEGEVVDEDYEPRAATAQDFEDAGQLREVLFLDLHEP